MKATHTSTYLRALMALEGISLTDLGARVSEQMGRSTPITKSGVHAITSGRGSLPKTWITPLSEIFSVDPNVFHAAITLDGSGFLTPEYRDQLISMITVEGAE